MCSSLVDTKEKNERDNSITTFCNIIHLHKMSRLPCYFLKRNVKRKIKSFIVSFEKNIFLLLLLQAILVKFSVFKRTRILFLLLFYDI